VQHLNFEGRSPPLISRMKSLQLTEKTYFSLLNNSISLDDLFQSNAMSISPRSSPAWFLTVARTSLTTYFAGSSQTHSESWAAQTSPRTQFRLFLNAWIVNDRRQINGTVNPTFWVNSHNCQLPQRSEFERIAEWKWQLYDLSRVFQDNWLGLSVAVVWIFMSEISDCHKTRILIPDPAINDHIWPVVSNRKHLKNLKNWEDYLVCINRHSVRLASTDRWGSVIETIPRLL
jgi:hypothetical protein